MASCSDKDMPETNSDFTFMARISQRNVANNSEAAVKDRTLIEDALKAAGYSSERNELILSGKDSADVHKKLLDVISKFEAKMDESQLSNAVTVKHVGVESQYFKQRSKNHPMTIWEDKTYGKEHVGSDDPDIYRIDVPSDLNEYLYGTDIRVIDWGMWSHPESWDDYYVFNDIDFNDGAGGSYIYVAIQFKPYSSGGPFITDMIAVESDNSHGKDWTLEIDGRTYHMASVGGDDSLDLNDGAHGDYIYLMYTYDYYDGNYLCNSNLTYEGSKFPLVGLCNDGFSMSNYMADGCRPVLAYDDNGNYINEEAEFNRHAHGKFIRLSGYYTHNSTEDLKQWVSKLPESTKLTDLTIPGTHDAATYSYDGMFVPQVKDQHYDYSYNFDWGCRAYDLRIGCDNHDSGSFYDRCKFFHGDYAYVSSLNAINDDVPNHFPTVDQMQNEFLIFVVKEDYHTDESKLAEFEVLMTELIKLYGSDRFIKYSPELTVGDMKGKILMFVRDEEMTGNYSSIRGTAQVPVNYITSYPDNDKTSIKVYDNAQLVATYDAYCQDTYENVEWKEKIGVIESALNNRYNNGDHSIFFNNFNCINDSSKSGQDNSGHINSSISKKLNESPLSDCYNQSIGICFTDNYAWAVYSGTTIALSLVQHNFR